MAGENKSVATERKLVALCDICGPRMVFKDSLFTMTEMPDGCTVEHLISTGSARYASAAELHEGRANVANSDMITELDSLRQQNDAKQVVINKLNAEIAKAKSLGHNPTDAQTSASKAEVTKMQQTLAELQKKLTDSEQKRFTLQKDFNDKDDSLRKVMKSNEELEAKNAELAKSVETLQQALDESTKPVEPAK